MMRAPNHLSNDTAEQQRKFIVQVWKPQKSRELELHLDQTWFKHV
jgi:hypothetical protein